MNLRFEHQDVLWALALIIPGLIAFFFWSWRKRRQLIAMFVQSRLLAHLTVGVSARRQKLRMGLLVLAAALLLIALARPQWGYHWEEARQRGLDVVVAIDTSRSMLAQDVAPNRLGRAKFAALDLKKLARTDRVGLIAFAGGAFLQSPLAFDDEAFRQNVNALDVNIIPQGGTAVAEAITTARAAFKEKNENYKVLVIFTDGEDHDGQAVDAAKDAAKDGIRIFTVGVGTANGEMLRIADAKGRSDYIRDDQGNVVKSRLNEKLLQDIAQAGNGFHMLLTGANTIDLLYERGLAPLPKAELSARHVRRYHERYQWFLGAAILALLVEMFLPERKRVRRSELIESATTNAELRKAVAGLLLLAIPLNAFCAAKLDEKGKTEYRSALRKYEKILQKRPYNAHAHYDAGTAALWLEDYKKAADHLNEVLKDTVDPDLQQRAYYNLGHAHFQAGEKVEDLNTKGEQWENALRAFQNATYLNPQDEDAKYNVEFVKKKLEELKKQQEQQQQQKDSQDKKDENKDKDQKQDQSDKKDQQPQDQKQDQQKQDQQKQDQQQKSKEDQAKEQEQQQQKSKEEQANKTDEQKKDQQQAQQQSGNKDDKEAQQSGSAMRAVQMTPQQAQQLLDAQKSEERALLFIPQLRTNRQQRVLKDW